MATTKQFMDALRFVSVAMGKDVTRRYLCAVNIECGPELLTITATDGHRCHSITLQHDSDLDQTVTIDAESVKRWLASIKPARGDDTELDLRACASGLEVGHGGVCSTGLALEDCRFPFPDWRGAIPEDKPVAVARWGIDPLHLSQGMKAVHALGVLHCSVTTYGEHRAILIRPDASPIDALCIVMPVKLG